MHEAVLELICFYYGVSVEGVLSISREPKYVTPRHLTMYILKVDFKLNDASIASILHRRRGTVYYGAKQIENIQTCDKDLLLDLINVRTFISNPSLLRPKHKKIEKSNFSTPEKRIYQYDLEMNQVGVFDNIETAVGDTGVSASTITRSIVEYKKQGRNFYWIKK